MATDLIRYDLLVQDALRGVVRTVLADAAKNGLKGDHHFFITFKTDAPGLRLSDRMRERYPEEMTIILQHQFWDLGVTEHAFEVGLSFSNKPERLLVPFSAITTFHDPSVQFGLKFDLHEGGESPAEEDGSEAAKPAAGAPAAGPKPAGPKRMLAAVEPAGKSEAAGAVAAPSAPTPLKPAEPRPAAARKGSEGKEADAPAKDAPKPETVGGDAPKVVSIDAFRKKP